MRSAPLLVPLAVLACPAPGQTTANPYDEAINASEGIVTVGFREFATLPEVDGAAARMMLLIPEPGSTSLLVNDMRGPIYRVSADGASVSLYLDINAPAWGVGVQSQGRERGFQSFAFHPQFHEAGTPGFGKFYAWTDVVDRDPPSDFVPNGNGDSHDTVLLEWTAKTPGAARYDGGAPRQLLRLQQPYGNHNGGMIAFNPLVRQGDADFGMLYVGVADGGSGGDPMHMAQNLLSAFGKILRIDPLARTGRNGQYGVPADNPFVGRSDALDEIWALGVRNPQRFGWDPTTGAMYVADIGQNVVEEVSPVPKGGNLGWNTWEGSFMYEHGGVVTSNPRSDPTMTYPIAEFDHTDPLFGRAAVTGVVVYRGAGIPALANRIIFGDNPGGELLHVPADDRTTRGPAQIRRLLLDDNGRPSTLLSVIGRRNMERGATRPERVDLRFGTGPGDEVFLLNKADGVIRQLTPR